MIVITFRVEIRDLVPRRVFESKITTVRLILMPFRVWSQKNILTGTTFIKNWYLLGVNINCRLSTPKKRASGTSLGFLSKFPTITSSILYGIPPRGGGRACDFLNIRENIVQFFDYPAYYFSHISSLFLFFNILTTSRLLFFRCPRGFYGNRCELAEEATSAPTSVDLGKACCSILLSIWMAKWYLTVI